MAESSRGKLVNFFHKTASATGGHGTRQPATLPESLQVVGVSLRVSEVILFWIVCIHIQYIFICTPVCLCVVSGVWGPRWEERKKSSCSRRLRGENRVLGRGGMEKVRDTKPQGVAVRFQPGIKRRVMASPFSRSPPFSSFCQFRYFLVVFPFLQIHTTKWLYIPPGPSRKNPPAPPRTATRWHRRCQGQQQLLASEGFSAIRAFLDSK